MNTQNKEDILALKKRQVKLKFLVGVTGAGKSTHALKLQQEFDIIWISTSDIVKEESKKNNSVAKTLNDCISKGNLVPAEIILTLLLRKLVNTKGKIFIITGFPRTLDQAIYIEKNLQEICFFLNFSLPEDMVNKRILSRYQGNISEDTIEKIINEYKSFTLPMINFYRRFGIVRDINGKGEMNEVYRKIKENLIPEIYCINGKKYSGKSTISKAFEKRINMKHINFSEFLERPIIKKRINEDEYVIDHFIEYLKTINSRRVIIEDFPKTESQYKLFVKSGKEIKKVYILNTEDFIISERMMKLGKDHENYLGCSKLKEELDKYKTFNCKMFLNTVPGLIKEFDVNNYLHLDLEDVINQIKPKILMFGGDNEMKNSLINHYIEKENYALIDVSFIFINNIIFFTK
jgi:adenylate kinase